MRWSNVISAAAALGLSAAAQLSWAAEPIAPVEPVKEVNLAEAELGKKLYFDPRLSKSGFISCNSCHNLSMGGTDNLKTSIGHNWSQGPINAPTVLNSSLNVAQFWDGRAADLKEQAGGPIANPGEMAFTHVLAVDVLKSIPGYVQEFRLVFGTDEINIDQVTSAIAEFEKTLVTPGARFDQWLLGDADAITAQEKAGYELFKNSGCVACHNGAAVGGSSFQKMGLIEAYQTKNTAQGLAGITGKDADRMKFKVPTLRNVELTYPYFHDGEAQTLTEAVDIMGRLQLGRKFSDKENAQIVAFLKTLTGDQPLFNLPLLPPSTDKTPVPTPFD
ncbi:MAG: cytochrome C biogenesis protein CcsA [Oceanospirillaceae bacterium]|uniref:cytochrome-c peroxidase n=1 Tax=unclassified Thalassolituus TaxID=2624967 RepID=UPI000C35655C|nr:MULTISPECIES: cytochrome-c peroxidase [unclassified Thalassolituus]MAS24039.1 cytochrome C biogenesis protein CcsA [Oceanospirillaceae bacterium]MAX98607.1 cytochrome C biogenesis protein CcsA [Oceanospirillaceae bacterium]MBS53620.1 cytochrome C biogenesis protein CcsA [Oceanospirillaceae bacterium]|tara:strand:+ start:3082 stop:4077 length:996 start_codon:yes stop_codon:yes gene_type:complete